MAYPASYYEMLRNRPPPPPFHRQGTGIIVIF